MTARETAGRPGKGEDGRGRTREVKLAVFFTRDKLDKDGYPVRDPGSSSYLATFELARVFADLVEAEGIRRGAAHVRQLTILGDGAAWIWNIATAKFPGVTQIVDLFHGREPLNELAWILEFMLSDLRQDWLAARLDDLGHGDIDGICAAARAYPLAGSKKIDLDKALGYFENNAPRMRGKWFRSRGLFVSSGAVEAGCKAVPPAPETVRQEMDRRRRRRHHRPALPRRKQPAGNHLPRTAQPDSRRLTRQHPKTIMVTYKMDAHPGFGVLRAFVVSPWQDQTRPEPPQGVAAPICSTLTCTSIRDSRVPAARTATSSTFRRGRCARACACSEPETSPIPRGRPSCGKPWSRQSPACSGSGRSWKNGSSAIPRLPAQAPSGSCSPSRSPRSTGAGSAPGKSITLSTRRASTPRTGSPRRWPRSATWHRTAGRFSAWILVICWTSRYRPIRTAFSSRPTSGLRGSPSSAQNPASTRSRNATPTWPSTYSRWRPACPRIRR